MPQSRTLDIAYVVDCTESMGVWMSSVRHYIRRDLDVLHNQNPGWTIRVALVCYRDFGDEIPFHILDFRTSEDRMEQVLAEIETVGGIDETENVAGALWVCNRLSWQSEVRFVTLLTDAPAHGRRYRAVDDESASIDRFPQGNPDGRILEVEVRRLAETGVCLTCARITPKTDRMFDVFDAVYRRFSRKGAWCIVHDIRARLQDRTE
jgi:hypothetical protein